MGRVGKSGSIESTEKDEQKGKDEGERVNGLSVLNTGERTREGRVTVTVLRSNHNTLPTDTPTDRSGTTEFFQSLLRCEDNIGSWNIF